MSLPDAVIDAMVSAGCTAEQLAAAVKAANAAGEARRAAKRANNAERQRRFKAKGKVTTDNAGNALPGVTPPNKEIPPKPPKEINPPISPTISNEMAPPLSVDEVLEGWNELAANHGLAQVRKLTDQRRRKVQAQAKRFSVPDWQAVFAKISQSPFLKGENDRGWRCDFDFILSEQNFVKTLEGKYDRQPTDHRR